MRLFGNMKIENNELYIGNISAAYLAKEYGTPLYVFDEEYVRNLCRRYYNAFKVKEKKNKVAYAGKAFSTISMCQIVKEESLCLDVVSGGELYTAYKSGFDLKNVYFHGNNKTIDEIELGISLGVGTFVVDNFYELEIINEIANKNGIVQKVILRVTPGIEAHTHEYIKTGQIDSKFGFTINIDVMDAVRKAIDYKNIDFEGFHCHIGSQIFDLDPYKDAVDIMLNLIKNVQQEFNYKIRELDLGGGFGIYYKEGDKPKKIEEFCETILSRADIKSKELNIELPILVIEPGRSIIGNSGITLYTVGSVKSIPNVRKYVAVDGGMTDNIRPALYNAEYECMIANCVNGDFMERVTISGKCCESGDILLENTIVSEVKSGDVLAVLNTGAYGYSMSSNYNKIPRAAVVFVSGDKCKLVCRRQSYEDVILGELSI